MTTKIQEAEIALQAAQAELESELNRDSDRRDGSFKQEANRVNRQQTLFNRVEQCQNDLEAAKRAQP